MNKPPRLDPRVDPSTPLPRPPVPALRPKALPPDEKPTVELDGIEILKGMLREVGENMRAEFRVTNANIDSLSYEVTAIKGRVADAQRAIDKADQTAKRQSDEQERIRANLGALPETSDSAKSYIAKLARTEKAIEDAEAARSEAQARAEKERTALDAAIAAF